MIIGKKRTVLISGGTSGIGNALVRKFFSAGWNVATFGRNAGTVSGMQMEMGQEHFLALAADFRLENHVSSILDETARKFGTIDACILNAGTLGPAPLPRVRDIEMMDLRRTFETNLFANFSLMKRALRIMKSRSVLVHITSDAAVQPYAGWGAYGASKAAMRQLVEVLGVESNGSGLCAINFDPGDVDTEMHALAIPDADRTGLRNTADVAEELYGIITGKLGVVD